MPKHIAAVATLIAVFASGCERESGPTPEAATPASPPVIAASEPVPANKAVEDAVPETRVADITAQPQDFTGKTIQVQSDLESLNSPWSFVLDEARALVETELDNDVLIVGEQPLEQWGIDESWHQDKVMVTGTVRVLPEEQLRTELGEKIGEEAVKRYADRPIILARSVRKIDMAN